MFSYYFLAENLAITNNTLLSIFFISFRIVWQLSEPLSITLFDSSEVLLWLMTLPHGHWISRMSFVTVYLCFRLGQQLRTPHFFHFWSVRMYLGVVRVVYSRLFLAQLLFLACLILWGELAVLCRYCVPCRVVWVMACCLELVLQKLCNFLPVFC
jgi:hypothetical protein